MKMFLVRAISMLAIVAGAMTIVPAAGAVIITPGNLTVSLPGQMPAAVLSGAARYLRPHNPHAIISIDIGLPLRHQAELQRLVNRGVRLSEAQYLARYAPKPAQVRAVKAWARSHGMRITFASRDGNTVVAMASSARMEAAFHVRINDYQAQQGYTFYSIDRAPRVPARLGLGPITGLDSYQQFKPLSAAARRGGQADPCADPRHVGLAPGFRPCGFWPKDFRSMYANNYADPSTIDPTTHQPTVYNAKGQTIALVLWGGAISDQALAKFATITGEPAPMSAGVGDDKIEWQFVNCAATCAANHQNTDATTQAEIAMDVEYAHAMAPGSHLKYYLGDCATVPKGDPHCNSDGAGLLAAMKAAAQDTSANAGFVISNSWAQVETDPANIPNGANCNPPPTITSSNLSSYPFVCQAEAIFLAGQALGKTFYFAAGDEGSNSGGATLPVYPADSPNVVAVGGTSLFGVPDKPNGTYTYGTEHAWGLRFDFRGAGGGGCSAVIKQPPWQTGVTATIANGAPCVVPGTSPAPPGRAVPDISADADPATGAWIYYDLTTINPTTGATTGTVYLHRQEGGTSLATPLITGMMAMTDVYLLSTHQARLGWAAPKIYSKLTTDAANPPPNHYYSYFNDVTCGNDGFAAGPGWDEATGWGTPKWLAFSQGLAGIGVGPSPAPPSRWTCQNATPLPSKFLGATCHKVAGSYTCFAVGERGAIFESKDFGTIWAPVTTASLKAISCPLVDVCYAVGDYGLVLGTTDGGTTWSVQAFAPGHLRGIACPSATECIAVGERGLIMETTGTTKKWIQEVSSDSGLDSNLNAVACMDTTTCYVAGGPDGGAWGVVYQGTGLTGAAPSWKPLSVSAQQDLHGVTCISTSACFFVGDAGTIFSLIGLPGSPTRLDVTNNDPQKQPLYGVACTPGAGPTCVAVGAMRTGAGAMGTLLTFPTYPSGGGGATTLEASNVTGNLYAVSCGDPFHCTAVGAGGQITSEGVNPWTKQVSNTTATLYGVSCHGATQPCLAVGDSDTVVYENTNVSATWSTKQSGVATDLNGIGCATESGAAGTYTCYAAGDGGNIRKSSNGGLPWAADPTPESATLRGIACTAALVYPCFAVGRCTGAAACAAAGGPGAVILFKKDSNTAWANQRLPAGVLVSSLNAISCPSLDTPRCYAVGNEGTVLTTGDDGTWTNQPTPVPGTTPLNSIDCPLVDTCFAVGDGGTIIKGTNLTANPGANWADESAAAKTTNNLTAIVCTDEYTCFAGGTSGTLLSTTDGGTTWNTVPNPLQASLIDIASIYCQDATHCLAVGGRFDHAGPGMVLTLP